MGWSATGWGGRLWSLVQPNGLDKPVQSVGRLNDSARERAFEGLHRDNVAYRPLDEEKAFSPIIMSTRKGDKSPEIAFISKLIREMYRKEGIAFGI